MGLVHTKIKSVSIENTNKLIAEVEKLKLKQKHKNKNSSYGFENGKTFSTIERLMA